jgi:hypothetical protein
LAVVKGSSLLKFVGALFFDEKSGRKLLIALLFLCARKISKGIFAGKKQREVFFCEKRQTIVRVFFELKN